MLLAILMRRPRWETQSKTGCVVYNLYFGVQQKNCHCQEHRGSTFPQEREFELGNNDLPLDLAHQLLCKEKGRFERSTLISKKQNITLYSDLITLVQILQSSDTAGHRGNPLQWTSLSRIKTSEVTTRNLTPPLHTTRNLVLRDKM